MSLKVLVIGANGFIGNNTVVFLEKEGYDVYRADISINSNDEEKYFTIDSEQPNFESIFQSVSFDVCINASGAASVPLSFEDIQNDFRLNTFSVFLILDSIRKTNGSCKFINISSAAVYGSPEILPISEDSDLEPESPYGFHKLMSELICKEFYTIYKIPTCSLRVFSAFGPGLKKQLFWDTYQKMKKGNVLEMFGDGTETRDFIYIGDVVKSIDCVIKNAIFKGDILNIGNGEAITIREAVDTFLALDINKFTLNFKGKRIGDPSHWQADIQNLVSHGYEKSFSLKEGLEHYYDWLKLNDF